VYSGGVREQVAKATWGVFIYYKARSNSDCVCVCENRTRQQETQGIYHRGFEESLSFPTDRVDKEGKIPPRGTDGGD